MDTSIKLKAQPASRAKKKMDPVVHFEMPAENRERMAKFYNEAFGWQSKMLGEDMNNYTLVYTAESDDHGPQERGRINGGFFLKDDKKPAQHPSVVIAVDDIEQSMKKITEAGGTVIGEPMEIPGYGLYVSFFDSEGNRNSLMQPFM